MSNAHLCCTAQKKKTFCCFFALMYGWRHLYLCIGILRHSVTLLQLQPHFCSENAPPGDRLLKTYVLSLQWGKRQQFLGRSKHRDIIAEVWKRGSRGLDLIVPVLYPSNIFTVVRERMIQVQVVFLSFWVRVARNKQCGTILYDT